MNSNKVLEQLNNKVLLLHLTAGTTDLGIVEELPEEILKRAKELGVWVHVDACYGAFNIGLLPESEGIPTQIARFQKLLHSP